MFNARLIENALNLVYSRPHMYSWDRSVPWVYQAYLYRPAHWRCVDIVNESQLEIVLYTN